MIPAIVAVIMVVAICCAVAAIYSALVTQHGRMDNAWRDVEAQLKRRRGLILGLVEAALDCDCLERETVASVLRAHNAAEAAAAAEGKMEADLALSSALSSLFDAAGTQPALAANTVFCRRREALRDTEEKLAAARQRYNERVLIYNNAIQTFPGNICAGVFQFKERSGFENMDV